MEAARAAVSKFTGNRGHHTTVEETVNPAVTHETIKPHQHEEVTQAVDREVHQHHHHTTVQPLQHQEILPEKHVHNIVPTEHREYHHDDESRTKERIAADLAKFQDHSTVAEVHTTQAAAPTVTGEHVHHHVHETVVPVIHKETIQPEVVHTTVPVHETHHAAAQHHGMSALPMKTLDEFKKVGGSLTGGSHQSHEEYDGAPRPYNDKLSTTFEKLEEKFHTHPGHNTSGAAGTNELTGQGSGSLGHHSTSQTGMTGGSSGISGDLRNHRQTDSGVSGMGNDYNNNTSSLGRDTSNTGGNNFNLGTTGTNETTHKKPSLMDRLNPKKDTDGDGKGGIMD